MESIRKYGDPPYRTALVHGGPGAAGEMRPLAEQLVAHTGVLECIQTKMTIVDQVEELKEQLLFFGEEPKILIGYSWGAWLSCLVAARYPFLVNKLILVSAGSFSQKHNGDLMKIRFSRLDQQDKTAAETLMSALEHKNPASEDLEKLGLLMRKADAFELLEFDQSFVDINVEMFQAVWSEAAHLRNTGQLLKICRQICCPVIAFHGLEDPHPVKGVEIPLTACLADFRMIKLEKCGHTPWIEKYARERFLACLTTELSW
ncbi:MAG TPA: alpha/beta hydrolase [Saprospirales bacterium]|nr:alpha/beta hydrolase [Saprospirales bacterium]HRQ29258.1 alpha/beta hydrolase [Saprospiraceae bacterium]